MIRRKLGKPAGFSGFSWHSGNAEHTSGDGTVHFATNEELLRVVTLELFGHLKAAPNCARTGGGIS